MRRLLLALVLSVAPLVASTGCGGSGNTVWVTGKLLKGGTPYLPPGDQLINVTFVALEVQDAAGKTIKNNEPYMAELNPKDGTFSVPGADRQGIPPGKYRVAVTQRLTREAFNAAKPKGRPKRGDVIDRESDTLKDRFGPDTSPILRDIPKSTDLVIDLDKPAA